MWRWSIIAIGLLLLPTVAASNTIVSNGIHEEKEAKAIVENEQGDLVWTRKTTAAAAARQKKRSKLEHNHDARLHRKLQTSTRSCGEVIGIITAQELATIGELFLGIVIPSDQAFIFRIARSIVVAFISNDILISKQCSSCSELAGDATFDLSNDAKFLEVCSETSYGFDASHSWLQMVPLNSTTQEPLQGRLRGIIAYHGTIIDPGMPPTNTWPDDVSGLLASLANGDIEQDVIFNLFGDFLSAMVAAGSGAVAILPDYIGYGESAADWNRTYLALKPYQQATAVSWLATQQVYSESRSCTILESVATLTGFSEGGFAAMASGMALRDLGVRILGVFASSAPFNLETQLLHIVNSYNQGLISASADNRVLPVLSAFWAFAYSNSYEFLANTDQHLVAQEWRDAVMAFFRNGVTTNGQDVADTLPAFIPDIFNADFLSQIQTALDAGTSLCDPGLIQTETDLLCQAFADNNAATLVETAPFPVVQCHSPDDTLVPVSQVLTMVDNPLVTFYNPPIPQLMPSGDHFESQISCALATVIAFSVPSDPLDAPNLITPLAEECTLPPPTSPPTPAPTAKMMRNMNNPNRNMNNMNMGNRNMRNRNMGNRNMGNRNMRNRKRKQANNNG